MSENNENKPLEFPEQAPFKRLCPRYPVAVEARICYSESLCCPAEVIEVSKTGLMLSSKANIPDGEIKLEVKFDGMDKWHPLNCEKVWERPSEYGLRILGIDDVWRNYVCEVSKTTEPHKIPT